MGLKVNNIRIVYKDAILAIKGFSIDLQDGAFVTLLGNNGAGKSTVLRAISGILTSLDGEIEEGYIEYDGQRIEKLQPHKIVKLGIIQVPEGRRLFPNLTVRENIMQGAYSRKQSPQLKQDFERILEYFPICRDQPSKLAGYLSGGEQQMVAIGRALMGNPKALLLDEPSLGLSPLIVDEIFEILQRINTEQKCAILLVEQNAFKALSVADYGYILENGAVVLDDTSSKLINNSEVREFYFGIPEGKEKKSFHDVKHYRRKKRWLS
ncbi:MAG: ABC transporter ATP-binding protein [Deltaproteobacteria bacterium]|jgi:branched-chain amino acid transport system ATP-binding protein|nr:ABC transporter ATP-binding protein [Deltaproteobacteria bacterium]MBT4265255.1 ABC transporter ATP-binding protein [Deltaproteobacteria bacterium]MBT4643393.1 ABC transporter ATP-binding protein [Deltaproteobacteria bacterium]MBT6501353.1 ABC transporter ATP-binding protein [Deltaproteobacteria bacterium]MBT6616253.1 ABC transporter ATP-binding protein [Deltaproteobacteria bacterium]